MRHGLAQPFYQVEGLLGLLHAHHMAYMCDAIGGRGRAAPRVCHCRAGIHQAADRGLRGPRLVVEDAVVCENAIAPTGREENRQLDSARGGSRSLCCELGRVCREGRETKLLWTNSLSPRPISRMPLLPLRRSQATNLQPHPVYFSRHRPATATTNTAISPPSMHLHAVVPITPH